MFQSNIFNKLNGQMIFNNKKTQVFQKFFVVHIILFERIYSLKKFGNCIYIYYNLLFINYLSVKLSCCCFSSNFFTINQWFASTCFQYNYLIILKYETRPFLSLALCSNYA